MKINIRLENIDAAERELSRRGFAIGPRQGDAPRGIHRGADYISKWRGLSTQDREEIHGRIEYASDGRVPVIDRATLPVRVVVDAEQWCAGGALHDGNGAAA